MKHFISIIALLVISVASKPHTSNRDASPVVKCDCQCDPYIWADQYGVRQGNCLSTFGGAKWCYISNDVNNNCGDVQFSNNKYDNANRLRKWSYEACATPALTSPVCAGSLPRRTG